MRSSPATPAEGIAAGITEPECLVDIERVRANVTRMAHKAARSDVAFRPHFKTHQSAAIGGIFREHRPAGIAVSSPGMARYFADAGFEDITIALPLNPRLIRELDELAGRVTLGLLLDGPAAADALTSLANPVRVWVEVDTGQGRTGMAWDDVPGIVALAGRVRAATGRPVAGLLTHAGHSYAAGSAQRVRGIHAEVVGRMNLLAEEVRTAEGARPLISVGDTPCCCLVDDLSGVDEVRPGNFVFFDVTQLSIGSCAPGDIALAVACPVIGVYPGRGEIALHGGAVHLSKDSLEWHGERIFGLLGEPGGDVLGEPDPRSRVIALSQEHAVARVPDAGRWFVGDVTLVFPAHSCLTAEQYGSYLAVTGERIPRYRR